MTIILSAIIPLVIFIGIFFFPIPTAYIFAATSQLSPLFRRTIAYKILSLCVFLGSSISISILLANREYSAGSEAGYGDDLAHYANAFYRISTNSYNSIIELIAGSASYTGAAEPLFWIFVSILSNATQDFPLMHIALSLIGFSLIYIAGNTASQNGLFTYLLYSSTITAYALQGSAIRSGLAFSFIFMASAILIRNTPKLSSAITGVAAFTHFSALPIFLSSLLQLIKHSPSRKSFIPALLILLAILSFLLIALSSQDIGLGAKIQARTSEKGGDISSIVQFIVEFSFMLYIIRTFRNKIPTPLLRGAITIFIISIILLLFAPTAFSRFYRYEYIYYILILGSLAAQCRPKIGLMIILLAFVWHIFLIASRYSGVFITGGALDHILFSPFY